MTIAYSLQGLDEFLLYFAVAAALLVLFMALYTLVTPHREIRLIRAGNLAAAVSLAGAVLGFSLPLASAIAHSVSLVDMAVWAAIALVVQLLVFALVNAVLRGLARQIEDGRLAAGVTLAAAALATGLLNAACMTY
jgi:putative membrane protein